MSAPAIDPNGEVRLTGVRVLVVDDEPDARRLLHALLDQKGATVREAGSAEEALSVLAGEPFDLLIADIGMPEMDGYELIQRVKSSLPALPAIDRKVITMRAGVNGTPLTRPQVGARLGLSRQAVLNTERRALNRLQYADASTGCGGTLVGPFDVAGIGNLTPQLFFAGAVPVNGSTASLTAGAPTGDFTQTRGILPRATSPLFELGTGGGSGPAWVIILFTVLFSVAIAALTRELRSSF